MDFSLDFLHRYETSECRMHARLVVASCRCIRHFAKVTKCVMLFPGRLETCLILNENFRSAVLFDDGKRTGDPVSIFENLRKWASIIICTVHTYHSFG